MSFKDALKKAGLVSDDPASASSVAVAPTPTAAPARIAPGFASGSTFPSTQVTDLGSNPALDSEKAYQRLLADTDLNNFPAYKAFMDEVSILERALPGPGNQIARFNGALATLSGHSQLSKEQLLDVFPKALEKIEQANANFSQALDAKRKRDIDDVESQIEAIKQQIATLQQQQSDMIAAVGTARVQIQQAGASFAGAIARRRTEIQTEQGTMVATLK